MAELLPGLYEQLLTRALQERLRTLSAKYHQDISRLHPSEAADRIAMHLGTLLRQTVDAQDDPARAQLGVALAQDVIALLVERSNGAVDANDMPLDSAAVLRALLQYRPDGQPQVLPQPATPLLDTTLLTNAPGEPRVGHQLRTEIPSADRIDVLMAFVRKTGIQPLLDVLRQHCAQGRKLRVLTTIYTGSTELRALELLQGLGAEIRVSYDVSTTRLHAKAWLFHRRSGFSTAYIGSSNLTHSAQVTGLEWNVRVAGARNPDVIEKFSAVFESYWQSEEFRTFDAAEFSELTRASAPAGPRVFLSPIELRPEPFQARMLELIALARVRGQHRNLLVSATGTGKTVMAALDYQRLQKTLPRSRLLFVAHRKEILEQSQAIFRHALRDAAFGEPWVDGQRPERFEHVFASIQSLSASGLARLAPDHFDVVIVDEFHHAAAKTYQALLEHLAPRELLGLTATPERADGEPILHWFDDRIAAELRLWDAIEQQRLCPFAYFGVSDGTDLSRVTWRRGSGYDVQELENIVTGNDATARLVVQRTSEIVPDLAKMCGIGFCVSVRHAQFMARHFNAAGIAAVALTGQTPMQEREDALRGLHRGELRIVFTVDLFNEGVDIPSANTLLLLRPTDSPTLFLQQLGRGLRRHPEKAVCTVLDFVGRHRKEFRFQRRLGALLNGSRRQLMEQVEQGFPFLPSGCHMQLDAVATREVLRNLRESLPSTFRLRAEELRRVAEESNRPTLSVFLEASGLSLEDVYASNHCWSDLLEAGGLAVLPAGEQERALRRALGRLLHADDDLRIGTWLRWVSQARPPDARVMAPLDRRVFHMLLTTLFSSVSLAQGTLSAAADCLWRHPQVLSELGELLAVLLTRISHVQQPLVCRPEVPLRLHARYTRREIQAALGQALLLVLPAWREGVAWHEEERLDVFVFTLDKTGDRFSPTTRYRDFAISPSRIHWESQSTTSENSLTGQRYQNHVAQGSEILLFARLAPEDRAFWFLGPACYVSHEGERPMAIQWELETPLPGDLFAQFAAAVA